MSVRPEDLLSDVGTEIDLPAEVSREVEQTIATPETYDKRKVQDRSGLLMEAKPKLPEEGGRLNDKILGDTDMLVCQRCNGEKFRLFPSRVENLIQFVCGSRNCGAVYPAFEIYTVQMNDRIAKAHGLYIPDRPMAGPKSVDELMRGLGL